MSEFEKQQSQASYGRPQHQTEPAEGRGERQQPTSSYEQGDGNSLEEEE